MDRERQRVNNSLMRADRGHERTLITCACGKKLAPPNHMVHNCQGALLDGERQAEEARVSRGEGRVRQD